MNPLKASEYKKLLKLNLKDLADKVNELTGHKGWMKCEHHRRIVLTRDNGNTVKGCRDCGRVIGETSK